MTKTWKRNTATCLPVPSPNVWPLLRMLMFMFVSRERTAGPVCTNYFKRFWTLSSRLDKQTVWIYYRYGNQRFCSRSVPFIHCSNLKFRHLLRSPRSVESVERIRKSSNSRPSGIKKPFNRASTHCVLLQKRIDQTDGQMDHTLAEHFNWVIPSLRRNTLQARVWSRFALAANTPVMACRLHDATILVVVQGREWMLNSAKIPPPSHPPLLPPLAKAGRA